MIQPSKSGGGNSKELILLGGFDVRTNTTMNIVPYVKDASALSISDFIFQPTALNVTTSGWFATYSASYNASTGVLTYGPSGGYQNRTSLNIYVYAEPA
jgi:hypothetical protein